MESFIRLEPHTLEHFQYKIVHRISTISRIEFYQKLTENFWIKSKFWQKAHGQPVQQLQNLIFLPFLCSIRYAGHSVSYKSLTIDEQKINNIDIFFGSLNVVNKNV